MSCGHEEPRTACLRQFAKAPRAAFFVQKRKFQNARLSITKHTKSIEKSS